MPQDWLALHPVVVSPQTAGLFFGVQQHLYRLFSFPFDLSSPWYLGGDSPVSVFPFVRNPG